MDVREMTRFGGPWLGAARNWLQCHKHNGSQVIFGSADLLVPYMSAADVDEIARVSAEAAYEHLGKMLIQALVEWKSWASEKGLDLDTDPGADGMKYRRFKKALGEEVRT